MKSEDVRRALAASYCQPEWGILFEVPNATGASHNRIADAVAMSLWPSRGLHIHGMEIKVNRYDWTRNELKNPAKAEDFYSKCDFFWIVTPEGIIQDGELPPTWGHIIVTEKLTTRINVQAPLNKDAKPVSKQFLAALMRAMHKSAELRAADMAHIHTASAEERIQKAINDGLQRRTPEAYKQIEKKWQDLITGMGFKPDDFQWHNDMADVASAYRILKKAGLGGMYNDIKFTLQRMEESLKNLKAGLEQYDIEIGDKKKNAIKAHTRA